MYKGGILLLRCKTFITIAALLTLSGTIVSGCSSSSVSPASSEVPSESSNVAGIEFPPVLQEGIREALRLEPGSEIKEEDLTNIEHLHLQGNHDIVDLTGVKKLTHLQSIELHYVHTENYDFLYSLPNLAYLEIRGITASQLPDFHRLKLKNLNLYDGDITTLDFLSGLKHLSYLTVMHNQLENLNGIQDITGLKGLRISYNPVSDINVIKKFDQLERLEIRSTNVKDISVLSNLTHLKHLDIRDTEIDTVSPISELPNLQLLELTKAKINDLDKLPNNVRVSEETIHEY